MPVEFQLHRCGGFSSHLVRHNGAELGGRHIDEWRRHAIEQHPCARQGSGNAPGCRIDRGKRERQRPNVESCEGRDLTRRNHSWRIARCAGDCCQGNGKSPRPFRVGGEKVPEGVVEGDSGLRNAETRIVGKSCRIVQRCRKPLMTSSHQFIVGHFRPISAGRSISSCRRTVQRPRKPGTERARGGARTLIRLRACPVIKGLILRRQARMGRGRGSPADRENGLATMKHEY